jgi:hypothetical protein
MTNVDQEFLTGASGPGGVALDEEPTIAALIDSVEGLGPRARRVHQPSTDRASPEEDRIRRCREAAPRC